MKIIKTKSLKQKLDDFEKMLDFEKLSIDNQIKLQEEIIKKHFDNITKNSISEDINIKVTKGDVCKLTSLFILSLFCFN